MKKSIFLVFFPVLFFLIFSLVLFRPYITKGLMPIPADILLGHYYPWKDQVWQGRQAGYPVKNFLLFDGIRQTLPWRLLAVDQMKAGDWPLWNPYILSGTPLLGNLQTAAFYPINFLFFVLPKLDAWTIYLFLQPFLAGIFTYFFVKDVTKNFLAGLLAGTCYAFSSIMMNHLEFGIDGHTALWLPLALLSINKIQDKRNRRWLFLLTFSLMMSLLGGYPPPAIYSLIIVCFYALLKIRPLFSSKLLMIILGIILAFGLASPQVLPAVELSRKIIREESQFGVSSDEAYFFPFENLLTLFAPDFFGHPSTNNFFSKINYTDNPSIGIIGLLFVFFAFFQIKKKETLFWVFLAIIPLLLMTKTFLGTTLRSVNISFISLVTPLRMIWIVTFALAVLAGMGMAETGRILKEKKFWKFFLPIILVWEFLFLTWILSFLIPRGANILISQRNLVLPTVFLSSATILLILTFFKPIFLKVFCFFCVLLATAELIREGIKYNPFIERELVFPKIEILSSIGEERPVFRTLITHQELLPVNSNLPYKLAMVDGYASIQDGRYGQMVKIAESLYPIARIEGYPRVVFQTEYRSNLIDLLGVKYVLSLEDLKDNKLKIVNQVGWTRLYKNIKVFPKAFFVRDFLVAKNDFEIANNLLQIDLRKTVVLEKPPLVQESFENYQNGEVNIVNYSDNEIILETKNDQPGILVVNDSFDSGWKASIDNGTVEILRANYDLRAVEVPAGKNKLIFVYKPISFIIGKNICLITQAVLIILLVFNPKLPLLKKKKL